VQPTETEMDEKVPKPKLKIMIDPTRVDHQHQNHV